MIKIKNNRFLLISSIVACFMITAPASTGFPLVKGLHDAKWNVYKSDHFIIHFGDGVPKDYVKKFSKSCEGYYYSIIRRLGFDRTDFWLFDDRANVFIYARKEDYMKKNDRKAWSAACVDYKKKIIKTYFQEKDFFTTSLPHEMTHIILREFIGMRAKAPLWFDEGVAVTSEKGCLLKYLYVAKKLVKRGYYLPIDKMDSITPDNLIAPTIFYPIAGSTVIFLLESRGKRTFVEFCGQLKKKEKFYKALSDVYGIDSPEALNQGMVNYLRSLTFSDIKNKKGFKMEW